MVSGYLWVRKVLWGADRSLVSFARTVPFRGSRVLYRPLRVGRAYVENGRQADWEQFRVRPVKALERRAQDFGFTLVPRSHGEHAS